MSEFKQYRRKSISEMRPYVEGEVLESKVSVSEADKNNGSPKIGDMIARNPKNHEDQWLVAKDYFEDNLEPNAICPHWKIYNKGGSGEFGSCQCSGKLA